MIFLRGLGPVLTNNFNDYTMKVVNENFSTPLPSGLAQPGVPTLVQPITSPPPTSSVVSPPIDDGKLIGLIPAMKATLNTLLKNEILGYFIKTGLALKMLMVPITLVGFIFFAVSMFSSTKSLKNQTVNFQPSTTYNTTVPTDNYSSLQNNKYLPNTKGPPASLPLLSSLLILLLSSLYVFFSQAMYLRATIDADKGAFQNISTLIKTSLKKVPAMLALTFLMSFFILLGFALFFVPGIILSVMFGFAPLILVADNVGPIEALKRSKNLVSGYKFKLSLRLLSFMFLIMVSFLPFVILFYPAIFVVAEIAMAFQALLIFTFYKDLLRIKG